MHLPDGPVLVEPARTGGVVDPVTARGTLWSGDTFEQPGSDPVAHSIDHCRRHVVEYACRVVARPPPTEDAP